MRREADTDPGGLVRLRRLFDHDAWANREAIASLIGSGEGAPPLAQAVKVLAHVLGAERLWLDRLLRAKPSVPVWPEARLETLRADFDDMARRWEDLLDDLEPSDLDREIEYVNSKGEPWKSTVGDVLDHVVLHSSYHRGQIASHLRAAGREPAYTDFIHAVRQGFVE
ncbi:MAG: DinB family protein [Planctomycetota bacterium]